MTIFGILKQKQTAKRQNTLADYHKLLGSIDHENPSVAEQASLSAVLSSLGKTPEEAEKDFAIVAEIRKTIDARDSEALASANVEKLHSAHMDALAERQRVYAEQNEKVRLANNAATDAREALDRHAKAKGKLKELEQVHTSLYAVTVEASKKRRK